MQEPQYTNEFFDNIQESSRRSARAVVPLVLELLQPASVCDVGCARGTWLSVFQEHGIEDVYGIDGEHVDRSGLEIPAERFGVADLRNGVRLDRRFDLALCLEVAEHLPEDSAEALIDGLVRLAPAVLFSAAIPGQGGRAHVNEQWPDYWDAHFRRHGYVAVDCIRPRIWSIRQIQVWYSQNTLLFLEQALLDSQPRLANEYAQSKTRPLSVVHPVMFERASKRPWVRLKNLIERRDSGLITEAEYQAKIAKLIGQV